MDIHFASEKLRKVLSEEKSIIRKYGTACAKKIMARMSTLRAVSSWAELTNLPGSWHALKADRQSEWSAELADGKRLIVLPRGEFKNREDGSVDLNSIREVMIKEIIDYH